MNVREVIRLLEDDGWVLVRQTGSLRHYRHATKPGTTTVAGNLGRRSSSARSPNILRHAGLRRTR